MSDSQWRRVSPLSVVFYLAQLARAAARQIVQLTVPAAAVLAGTGGITAERVYGLGLLVAAGAVATAIARYANFRFFLGDESIVIRSGVFSRNQLNIQYDRIQAINDSQNPVYRLFNLVNLKLDTPGSAESEADLPAVSPDIAQTLRERVRAAGSARGAGAGDGAPETAQVVHSLGTLDMLRIGLSSRTVLVFLAVIPWLLDTVGERFSRQYTPEYLFNRATGAIYRTLDLSPAATLATLVVALLVVLGAVSIVAAMLRFNGYTLTQDGSSFSSRAGLLTVRSHAVATRKIQCLTLRRSMMLGLFSGTRLTAFPAASYQQEDGPFLVPFATGQQAVALARRLWGNDCRELSLTADGDYLPVDRRYKGYLFLRRGVIPAAGLGAFLLLSGDYTGGQLLAGAAAAVAWLLAVAAGAELHWRRLGIERAGDGIAVRRGLIGWQVDSFPARKVQSVEVTQTFLQRRRQLASLRLSLAQQPFLMPV
ncbi:MAG: PH domain-containing protein, partial [Pseudomonadota bacterium]